MKWLVVGAGDIAGKRIVPALIEEPRSEVTAVCDLDEGRAKELAAGCGARVFTDYARALADPDVESVYICTPVFLHTPMAVAALEAGRHVIVEKPPALNSAEAQMLVNAAAASGRKCAVAYFRRLFPKYAMAREMIEAGEFGRIALIRLTYFSWFNPAPDDPKRWRVLPERSGGGPVSDMGTHMFDVMIGLLGVPESICARAETLTHDYDAEDSCVAIFKMPDGAQGLASFHWNSKTWSHEFEIIGAEAKLKWHPYDDDSVLKTVGRDIQSIEIPNPPNVHYPLIHDFVSAVEEGRDPVVTPAEAARTTLLIDALYRSAREGREVRLSEMTP